MIVKPKIGIFGLTGCSGEQIVILNCEDELLDIAGAVDIKVFHTATSDNDEDGPLDIAFVEGSVVKPEEVETLKSIRKRAKLLVAIGTCAAWGGIPAMHNELSREELCQQVYGGDGKSFETIPPQPLRTFVKVDYVISGCPMEKEDFLRAVPMLVHGDLPLSPNYAVCTECKMRENECLLLRGHLCVGPLTQAGCNARCPSYGVACCGCRGPVDEANVASEVKILQEKGFTQVDIHNALRTFAAPAQAMKDELVRGKNA
ncbi:MAG: NADH:ubiquinone oxidoreductase [candidate division KSB1 bacterium]|nr:NADH:ubiquinone oxidoreductase [candidate division KSB1 bacterium]MDZ7295162.1 NADH:ubiquinone oxidoreductase [candidate division KSB1 bacterium]MDZ7393538.1 NADH:ubiquinone oxidoreductase [candidate division KSB1 bacterium]MDZ7412389.1 NADH:ubiquinone oxidoreductase [candidate division KSB1 bacterium]